MTAHTGLDVTQRSKKGFFVASHTHIVRQWHLVETTDAKGSFTHHIYLQILHVLL